MFFYSQIFYNLLLKNQGTWTIIYNMKKSLIIQCLSLLIILFFSVNFLALSLFNDKGSVSVKNSSFEQILSALQNPTDMLSKMIDNNSKTKSKDKKEDKKTKSEIMEYILPSTATNFSSISNNFGICSIKDLTNYMFDYVVIEIDYPIKIPFINFIFLLLILKLIFSILKRSISINYNEINIDRACIV